MTDLRRLIVMRHAKSSWKSDATTDHERPLNKRGRQDAPRVGARVRELGWTPDLVLCSDALRTRQTFEGLCTGFGRVSVDYLSELYHAGIDRLAPAVSGAPPATSTLLVLGHNPGWEEAVAWLSGASIVMKTACAALLENEAESWPQAMVTQGAWRVHGIIRPRELSG